MRLGGEAAFSDYIGDLMAYRNLEPAEAKLPGLREVWREIGLSSCQVPRKAEPAYAQAVAYFLRRAQGLRSPGVALERLLCLGDTRMSDVTAIANLRRLREYRTLGFICSEDMASSQAEEVADGIFYANRWAALVEFARYLEREDFPLDGRTAAIIDLDKTALGARGRNDGVIDEARVEAVYLTVEKALGEDFRREEFLPIYKELGQLRYHPFTQDNQDYLVYICLMLSAGVYGYREFLAEVSSGELASFSQFVELCGERLPRLGSPGLEAVHREVAGNLALGDPTPFKSFRYGEYRTTVARMVDRTAEELGAILKGNIVLTQEVLDFAHFLAERGVLLFAISDKPDEASCPSPELAAQGYQPIHRVKAWVVGTPLAAELKALGRS